MSLLVARDVDVVRDGTVILDGVSLEIQRGEVLALVGPNGAGKSTLLGVLSGDARPTRGAIELDGRPIGDYRPLELARHRAVLTQENAVSFPFRAIEVIQMGRSPWNRTSRIDEDSRAVTDAVEATDVSHLLGRRYTSLSGGEKARVSLARVLAQRTQLLFLDEPTAALDLRHQEDVMLTARALAAEDRAVVVVLHDLSLAGAYADRIALLSGGRLVASGTPHEVLDAEVIGGVYGLAVRVIVQDGVPMVLPVRDSLPR
ncbi:heme ABC transporter ATP-binding protein [Ruicaihuangia caeni]|uniref:Heme ABC transporter ATP-binding protein n=1 Tax=Ruicaihuangia caeni TaxID=3042517 RepID=A0AAW6T9E7_9MICO|nr:heme ABC transporter ATP-binding protein [Klugiella sp. YN-L-19]MDI2098968.1 heme ABC transporter ATP-binding protein [Klugiella sp. YN-L-19]